jgi:hypothetical protein
MTIRNQGRRGVSRWKRALLVALLAIAAVSV